MKSLNLHNIFLEQQLPQTNNAYYEKLQKELNQLFSKNKNELENPSPYWSNSPDFKRIQELNKLLEPYTKQKDSNKTQSWVKSLRDTVNDQSASYPQAEKVKDMDMWLNMWARDFILEFSKNELGKLVPSGSYGYCQKGYIHTYDYLFNKQEVGRDREFQGKNSLYQQLLNIKNLNKDNTKPKLYICDSQLEMMTYKWDHKFDYEGEKIGWFQLLNLDWGIADKQKMQSAWNVGKNYIATNKGEYCTENGGRVHCKNAIYIDPLTWFKDPHNLLMTLELVSAFIPIVGPVLSAGFGLGNAALYLKQGNKKEAALYAFFAILPGLGAVGAKITLKLGEEALEGLATKLITNGLSDETKLTKEFLEKNATKFTDDEIKVLEGVVDNKKFLENEAKSLTSMGEKELTKTLSSIKNKTASSAVDVGVNVLGAVAGEVSYPIYKFLKPGVREKVEKMGYSWEYLKFEFGSSGTTEDNKLLINALNSGWKPGTEVPEKFQTKSYKETQNMFKGLENQELLTYDERNNILNDPDVINYLKTLNQ